MQQNSSAILLRGATRRALVLLDLVGNQLRDAPNPEELAGSGQRNLSALRQHLDRRIVKRLLDACDRDLVMLDVVASSLDGAIVKMAGMLVERGASRAETGTTCWPRCGGGTKYLLRRLAMPSPCQFALGYFFDRKDLEILDAEVSPEEEDEAWS